MIQTSKYLYTDNGEAIRLAIRIREDGSATAFFFLSGAAQAVEGKDLAETLEKARELLSQ